jgi:hypothetical protein
MPGSGVAPELIPFLFENQSVRIIMIDGEPWWVATDIADIFDYRNASDMARSLDDDEKGTHIMRTLGGDQEVIIINESGLYSVIFGSRKEEAKRFKKWVTSEVLPAIRKTGSYSLPSASKNPRLILGLINAYRAYDLSCDAWARQGLITGIVALSSYLGLSVPDFTLIGKRATQMPLFGEARP